MILVTGGTGLLGSHLLFDLTLLDTPIRAIYRDPKKIKTVESLFQFYAPQNWKERFNKIEWVEGEILDIVFLEHVFKGIEFVYHCAGLVSFSKKNFSQLIKINREGTANIVNTSLKFGVKKLCHVSSTAAIGGENNTIITEETKWKQSPETDGYSISKYSAEKEVWRGVEEGLDCIIVNPSVIFGAGDWNESSLKIFRTASKGLKFYTSGEGGFVDARDVSHIMIKLMQSEIKNERFLCVGVNLSYKELFSQIARALHKNPPTILAPKWLMQIAWRLSWVLSKFTGKDATVTKASARSAYNVKAYSCEKVINALDFSFLSIENTINNTVSGKLK